MPLLSLSGLFSALYNAGEEQEEHARTCLFYTECSPTRCMVASLPTRNGSHSHEAGGHESVLARLLTLNGGDGHVVGGTGNFDVVIRGRWIIVRTL